MRSFAVFLMMPRIVASTYVADLQPPSVPEFARELMPSETDNIGSGLVELLRSALLRLNPDLREGLGVCMAVIAVVMMVSLLESIPGAKNNPVELAGAVAVGLILLEASNSMIQMARQVIMQMSDYGKLLLPVMATALAAQGGITSSGALYSGTMVFDSLLTGMIIQWLIPMVYLILALALASSATPEQMLSNLLGILKSAMTWILKTLLYIYTGYIGVTGVVSGTTDAAALKAAKLTISSVVPVVGGILSDASEAVLVGAGTVKNAAGLYGLFAVLAIWISPFLKIGIQYLLLKTTAALCTVFGSKRVAAVVEQFSSAMGFLLAMSGAVCLILLISTICFMKGVS